MIVIKALSLLSTMLFLARGDGKVTVLHRLSGLSLVSSNYSPALAVRSSQLSLEHRKFLWTAMIVRVWALSVASRHFC